MGLKLRLSAERCPGNTGELLQKELVQGRTAFLHVFPAPAHAHEKVLADPALLCTPVRGIAALAPLPHGLPVRGLVVATAMGPVDDMGIKQKRPIMNVFLEKNARLFSRFGSEIFSPAVRCR